MELVPISKVCVLIKTDTYSLLVMAVGVESGDQEGIGYLLKIFFFILYPYKSWCGMIIICLLAFVFLFRDRVSSQYVDQALLDLSEICLFLPPGCWD